MATAAGDHPQQLHVAMFPLFAIGHITPYLHLSNQLAAAGHRISFLMPAGTISKVSHLNNHPHLITFHPITVPHVDGLPVGAETIADVPDRRLVGHIFAALDATEDQFRSAVRRLRPQFVLYDAVPWVPRSAAELGFVPVSYGIVSVAAAALRLVPSARIVDGMTDEDLSRTPPGYPSSTVVPRPDEIAAARVYASQFGTMSFYDRIVSVIAGGDVIALRSCRELEGEFVDYIGKQYGKRVLLTGPGLPETDGLGLDEEWASWLGNFPPSSVVYCAFGSEVVLERDQFHDFLRGLELCGRPFLAVLRPPPGHATVEEALPDGFAERVAPRGIVCGKWVPQPQILEHPSVGCYVSHCGYGSIWESLMSDCQMLLIPKIHENIVCAMLLAKDLKVAMEIEKDVCGNGWVSKEELCRAIGVVMDEGSEVGEELRRNHMKLREALRDGNFGENNKYMDGFVSELRSLLHARKG